MFAAPSVRHTPALTLLERRGVDTAGLFTVTGQIRMYVLTSLPERALQLASSVGDGIKDAVPDRALKWIETGAALGALKTGTRVASRFVRRNPAVAIAAAAGAGLLWYAARRRAKQAENGAIEGTATRIEAKREDGGARRRSSTAQRARRSRTTNGNT